MGDQMMIGAQVFTQNLFAFLQVIKNFPSEKVSSSQDVKNGSMILK